MKQIVLVGRGLLIFGSVQAVLKLNMSEMLYLMSSSKWHVVDCAIFNSYPVLLPNLWTHTGSYDMF
jgi:hypothetical protein